MEKSNFLDFMNKYRVWFLQCNWQYPGESSNVLNRLFTQFFKVADDGIDENGLVIRRCARRINISSNVVQRIWNQIASKDSSL